MNAAKLMQPLFYDGYFNSEGHKMRARFVREITNGSDTYRLWQSAGKPDLDYPRAENDAYTLYVEIGAYLVPLQMTEYALIDQCGYPAATIELYGGKEQRSAYFNQLRDGSPNSEQAISNAIAVESERIRYLGSEPARQADHIRGILEQRVAFYLESKENNGESFPDFIGALVLGELKTCSELSVKYRAKKHKEALERQARAEAEDRSFCEQQNGLADQKIQQALHIMKCGGELKNEVIQFFRSKSESASYSIINYLLRTHEVSVPLRTQGWINSKLVSVTIENGRCGHLRYMRPKGGQCSQRFFDCINELIQKVCSESEVV